MRSTIIYYRSEKYKKVGQCEKIKEKDIESRCGKIFMPLQNSSFIGKTPNNYSKAREFYTLI